MQNHGLLARLAFLLAIVTALGSEVVAQTGPDVLLTDRTARVLALAEGDTLRVSSDASMRNTRSFRVAGVYRPKADPFEVGYGRLRLLMHLPDLEGLLGKYDQVDRIAVRLQDPTRSAQAAREIESATSGLRAHTSQQLAESSSSTFIVISQFHKAIGVVSMLAGLVFLVAIMVLKVEGMRRELGVLALVGISRRTVLGSVVAIAALVAFLGSLLGIGLGFLAVTIVNGLAQEHYDTDLVFARPTTQIVALAVGLSMILGIVAGFLVALRFTRGTGLQQIGR